MNLALIPLTAAALLYSADKFCGNARLSSETRSSKAGFSALVATRQNGVNLATKPH